MLAIQQGIFSFFSACFLSPNDKSTETTPRKKHSRESSFFFFFSAFLLRYTGDYKNAKIRRTTNAWLTEQQQQLSEESFGLLLKEQKRETKN
jgi:hypothetical protein